jgi:hypothetical protein
MVDDDIIVRAKGATGSSVLVTEATRYADAFPGPGCLTGNTAWKIPDGFNERTFPVILLARFAFRSCCGANAFVNVPGHAGVALFFLPLSYRGKRANALPFYAGVAF